MKIYRFQSAYKSFLNSFELFKGEAMIALGVAIICFDIFNFMYKGEFLKGPLIIGMVFFSYGLAVCWFWRTLRKKVNEEYLALEVSEEGIFANYKFVPWNKMKGAKFVKFRGNQVLIIESDESKYNGHKILFDVKDVGGLRFVLEKLVPDNLPLKKKLINYFGAGEASRPEIDPIDSKNTKHSEDVADFTLGLKKDYKFGVPLIIILAYLMYLLFDYL